ncbi:MAG: DNA mismatch repair endonuclease MutL [Candidatus Dojkabacteria bacterium]|nr:MAG: DNA mismatch repair endonuclease MutL [Candidatus Dojkabacteria bacterium]
MADIKKLPQELINQIAAGEVIERPASVVKELIDNSIDAGADIIKIRINKGGLELIEVSDNGIGISSDMLGLAFEAHSTSKIDSLEDLNNLLTMGFRGEALSTIVAIADVTAISKHSEELAYKIAFEGITPTGIEPAARDVGTTVMVKNLFGKIPARRKYLRSAETEYRKVMQIILPYLIIYPNVAFNIEKDGRTIYNLPKIQGVTSRTLHPGRFREVVRADFAEEMVDIFYEGEGMKIGGLVAHPKFHQSKVNHIYTFVNGRPVSERGLVKSVIQGFDRFIPHGDKVPLVLMVEIKPDLVDVNVHPRKEEVRFINPYRVYSAVEQAVASALSQQIKSEYSSNISYDGVAHEDNAYSRLRSIVSSSQGDGYSSSGTAVLDFSRQNRSVDESIRFSENLLRDQSESLPVFDSENGEVKLGEILNVAQFFKKYIFVQFESELWVVDQHAAAERITFEKLLSNYNQSGSGGATLDVQNLLVPEHIQLEETELIFMKENTYFLESLGFSVEVDNTGLKVTAVPVEFHEADLTKLIKEVVDLGEYEEGEMLFDLNKQRENVLATIACHNSIRTNQKLHYSEGRSLVEQLMKCDNPYSCPHGRPIVWRISLTELDKNFDRTY